MDTSCQSLSVGFLLVTKFSKKIDFLAKASPWLGWEHANKIQWIIPHIQFFPCNKTQYCACTERKNRLKKGMLSYIKDNIFEILWNDFSQPCYRILCCSTDHHLLLQLQQDLSQAYLFNPVNALRKAFINKFLKSVHSADVFRGIDR